MGACLFRGCRARFPILRVGTGMRVWRKDESQEQKFDGEDVFLTITCAYTASKARKAWGKFDCLSKLEKVGFQRIIRISSNDSLQY
eukprot:1348636-Amorphochlora_amoeboformis.AAC.1